MTSSIYSIFASKLTSVLFDIFLPGKCQVMYRTNWCHDFVRFSFWLNTSNTTVLTTQHTTTNIDKSHLCHGDVSFWNARKKHHNPSAKNVDHGKHTHKANALITVPGGFDPLCRTAEVWTLIKNHSEMMILGPTPRELPRNKKRVCHL